MNGSAFSARLRQRFACSFKKELSIFDSNTTNALNNTTKYQVFQQKLKGLLFINGAAPPRGRVAGRRPCHLPQSARALGYSFVAPSLLSSAASSKSNAVSI